MKSPSRHHRKPRSQGGSDENRNISIVEQKHHKAFHTLFGNGNVSTVAKQLNEIWIDPDYAIVVVSREQIHLLSKLLK